MESWEDFISGVKKRLDSGAQQYGDRSFHKEPVELMKEVEEEILDIVGWSYILWARLHKLRPKLVALQDMESLGSSTDHVPTPVERR